MRVVSRPCRTSAYRRLNSVSALIPTNFPGGLRQRVMIALATLNNPSLLIADEPTTALDSTIQAQILDLLKSRIGERGMILVTHDLGVAAEICDRIVVMKRGEFIESGECAELLARPQHEYTKSLVRAVPSFRRRTWFHAVPLPRWRIDRCLRQNAPRDVQDERPGPARGKRRRYILESWRNRGAGRRIRSGKSTLISALVGHTPANARFGIF